MSHSNTLENVERELEEAGKLIKVGGVYAHYKGNLYKVISLAIQEATDKICVIYQAKYGKKLLFVRDLDSWLDNPEVNGEKVDRFRLVR